MTTKSGCISFFIVLLIFCLQNVHGWRTFWKGHRRDGNLMHPPVNVTKDELPPDQWFTQKLDHFNESSVVSWKQVSSITLNVNREKFFFLIYSLEFFSDILQMIHFIKSAVPFF